MEFGGLMMIFGALLFLASAVGSVTSQLRRANALKAAELNAAGISTKDI